MLIDGKPTGAQLARLREEAGISPAEMARRLGRSRSHILRIESGERDVPAYLPKRYLHEAIDTAQGRVVAVFAVLADWLQEGWTQQVLP